ncbi:hypothetical protein KKE54_02510 [bacterium]|jgi:hypothetical protein|nr:hypothetical protein [bacterium]
MKLSLLFLAATLFFAGCSQESGDKKSEQLIKVDKKVEKSAGKDAALICLEEGDNITCKLMTKRFNEPRSVKFYWQSPITPEDDRAYTVTLPATHASVFDTRHKTGRAQGNWKVTAKVGDEEAITMFRIQ